MVVCPQGGLPWPTELLSIVRNVARLSALQRLGLLDTPPEAAFDRLTRVACRVLRTPVGLVSLVDQIGSFSRAALACPSPLHRGGQTPVSHSFCQHVVATGKPLIVEDARTNPLVRLNPAVEELGIVAYAGIPLVTSDGHAIGSFCVIDQPPAVVELRRHRDAAGARRLRHARD